MSNLRLNVEVANKTVCLLLAMFLLIQVTTLYSFAEETPTYSSIALGSNGKDVSRLQTRLMELGYYTKSIDSEYGNGTKTAVASFQLRNGLTSNGIASAETVSAIYSDSAIPAPKPPNISITAVSFGAGTTKVTVRNNLDVTVDSITFKSLTYDAGGNVYVNSTTLDENHTGLIGHAPASNKTVKPGKTVTYRIDNSDIIDYNTKFIGIYIRNYHTVEGKEYWYSPEQVLIYKSDNSVVYPTNESEPDCMTDEEISQAKSVKFGDNDGEITTWVAESYLYPEGELLTKVYDGGTFDLAGLKAGDIIKSFDDIDALSGHSWEHAKLKMLNGGIVNIHYWRNNKEYTTLIATDMDSIKQDDVVKPEPTEGTESIAEQLQNLADLYQKGLLTKDEYDAAKAKLLN